MSIITKAWDALVRLVRPDVDAIISAFLKTQRKLEALIDRESAALANEANAIQALMDRNVARNVVVDRAYRLIHKLSELTA